MSAAGAGDRSVPAGRELAAVFAGGCAGALARTGLVRALPHAATHWPWATFLVNVLGALLLGTFAAALAARPAAAPRWRPFLATGVCGALTTFSALQLELVTMLRAGATGLAVGYAAASLVAGLAALRLGGRLVPPGGVTA